MTTYTTQPTAAWWDEHRGTHVLARTVHEAEPATPKFTGLLAADGTKIFRVEAPRPIGFVRLG